MQADAHGGGCPMPSRTSYESSKGYISHIPHRDCHNRFFREFDRKLSFFLYKGTARS